MALVTTSFILRNIFCLATLNIVGCLLLHFCYIKHASANVHCYICRTSILFPVWPSPLHGRVWHWKGPPPLGSLFATGGRRSCLWPNLAWFDKSLVLASASTQDPLTITWLRKCFLCLCHEICNALIRAFIIQDSSSLLCYQFVFRNKFLLRRALTGCFLGL